MLEHCSADKLMQQSRLTQQRAPNLAQCLREQPGHTGSPAKQKNHTIIKAFHLKLDSLKQQFPLTAAGVAARSAEELSLVPEVEPGGRASSARDVKLSGWGCTEEAQPTKPTV